MSYTIEHLNASLVHIIIDVTPTEFSDKQKQGLKEFRKFAQIKGFRPGTAPDALVKKMYGEQIQNNAIIGIIENDLHKACAEIRNTLGAPYPINEKPVSVNELNKGQAQQMVYEAILYPNIEFNLDKIEVEHKKVLLTTDIVQEEYGNFMNQLAKFVDIEDENATVADCANFSCVFTQIDETTQQPIENGLVSKPTPIDMDLITEGEHKNHILNLKTADKLPVKLLEIFDKPKETILSVLFNINKKNDSDEAEPDYELSSSWFMMEVTKLAKKELPTTEEAKQIFLERADINPESAQYQELIEKDLPALFEDSMAQFWNSKTFDKMLGKLKQELIDKVEIELPIDALKRLLIHNRESDKNNKNQWTKEAIAEDLEKKWDSTWHEIKWTLIRDHTVENKNIHVTDGEIDAAIFDNYLTYIRHANMNGLQIPPNFMHLVENARKNPNERAHTKATILETKALYAIAEEVNIKENLLDIDAITAYLNSNENNEAAGYMKTEPLEDDTIAFEPLPAEENINPETKND